MAKKREGGDSSFYTTLFLVIFVLLTIGLGVTAYFGYAGQDELAKKATEATKDKQAAEESRNEERGRKLLLRHALGIAEADDRRDVAALAKPGSKAAEEWVLLRNKFTQVSSNANQPNPKDVVPDIDTLTNIAGAGAEGGASFRSLPVVIADLQNQVRTADSKRTEAEKAAADAAAARVNAERRAANDFKAYEKARSDFEVQRKADIKSMDDQKRQIDELTERVTTLNNRLNLSRGLVAEDVKADLDRKDKEITQLRAQLGKLRGTSSLLDLIDLGELIRMIQSDMSLLGEEKGRVSRREANRSGDFGVVFINRGRNDYLRPQIQFAVFPANVKLQGGPSANNLKGRVEVVEVLGPNVAKCRILQEVDPVRAPISENDVIVNPLWDPGPGRENGRALHVAIAARFDLDGDGYDDNAAFMNELRKQGIVVDAYLDLKERVVKGEISYETSFIVVDEAFADLDFRKARFITNDPRIDAQDELKKAHAKIMEMAQQKGVLPVNPRRFMALMGFPPPRNPRDPRFEEYLAPRAPTEPKEGSAADKVDKVDKKDEGK